MKKILMFCDYSKDNGGIQLHCQRLKTILENTGNYQIDLYDNLSFKQVYLAKVYNKKEIISALMKDKYDYIHIHGFISLLPWQIIRCIKKLKIQTPIIYTPHAHPFYTLNHPIINKVFFNFFVKSNFSNANNVIAINKHDFDFFKQYNSNVVIIPHWYECEDNNIAKEEHTKKVILFVGRNESNKNLSILYGLPSDKYEVICVTNIKPDRDDFIFKNNISQEELKRLYKTADLTVIPSRYEAFSLVAVESLCYGTPILISDRVRIADFLDDVEGKIIYHYENEKEFYSNIEIAMKQKVNVEEVRKIFSTSTALEKYKQVFN